MNHARETSAYAYKVDSSCMEFDRAGQSKLGGLRFSRHAIPCSSVYLASVRHFCFSSFSIVHLRRTRCFFTWAFPKTPIGIQMVEETTFQRWFLHRIRRTWALAKGSRRRDRTAYTHTKRLI